jgi:hypothetical protein
LITHTPTAIAMTNFFLFQMAMLAVLMSKFQFPGEDVRVANADEDVRAEYDQERSQNKGQVSKEL